MSNSLFFICFDYIKNGEKLCVVQSYETENMAIIAGYSVNGYVYKMTMLSGITYLSLFEKLATRMDIGNRKNECSVIFEDDSKAKNYFGYSGLLSDYLTSRFESTANTEGGIINTSNFSAKDIDELIDQTPLDKGISATNLKVQIAAAKEANGKYKS